MIDFLQVSKTAYGRRTYFNRMDCSQENNLIKSSADKYFSQISNCENVSVSDSVYTLSGKNNIYFKFPIEKNNWYYLIFDGRVEPNEYADYEFGIADNSGCILKNIHTKREKDFFVWDKGLDDIITIKGQDGSWYNRTYRFFSGENDFVFFFAYGTVGKVQIKNLTVCLAENAYVVSGKDTICVREYSEPNCFCNVENNIANGIFDQFKELSYAQKFIEIKNNRIIYNAKLSGIHCIAWFDIKPYHIYTCTVKYSVLSPGKSTFGFITEDKNGFRQKTPLYIKSKEICEEKTESMTLEMNNVNKIGFTVFDGGGKIEIIDVYVFPDGREICSHKK